MRKWSDERRHPSARMKHPIEAYVQSNQTRSREKFYKKRGSTKMKKILSSLLAFAMVLALFSGVVVFNASAATEVQMHIPFINQYTLEQVQQSQMCNNGYLDAAHNASNVSYSKDAFGRVVFTATTSAEKGGHSNDSYNHIYLSTAKTATIRAQTSLIDDVNIFGNADLSNKTKLVIKVGGDEAFFNAIGAKNANFIFASSKTAAFVTVSAAYGGASSSDHTYTLTATLSGASFSSSANSSLIKGKTWADMYDALIDTLIIDFRFGNAATPTEVSFWIEDAYVTAAADTTALLSAIRSAKAAGVDDALITAAEAVFKNTASTQAQVDAAAESLGAGVRIQLPFINQYTLAQAQKMGTRYDWGNDTNNGRNYSFAKDDAGRTVVNFTTGTTIDSYGGVSAYLSTGTRGNFYYANPLIDGINVFEGVDLSNKSAIAFKWGGDDNFNNVVKSINLVLKNSSKKILLELKNGVKNADGYYEYRLTGMTFNRTIGYNELGIETIGETYDGIIDGLIFVFRANAVDTPVSCWLEDAYVVGSADDRELLSEIRKAKAEGILPDLIIDQAEAVYKNTGSLQSQVDAAVAQLKAGFSEYNYYPLTGFTATTQAELDTLSGNVGYADNAIYNSVTSKLELTENAGEVKLTTIPANNQKYNQSIVTYVKSNGATLANNPWTPLGANVDLSTMDGIRFKLTDANGKPVSYYGEYRFIVQASGWGNYWRYRGQPEKDDEGYNVIDFGRLYRASTTNTEMYRTEELKKIDGISFLLYAADTTLYFSDLQAYKRNVPRSYGMEIVDLPGFDNWTDDNLALTNALAAVEGQTVATALQFYDKAGVMRGNSVHGLLPTKDYLPNNYTMIWTTQTNADGAVRQQNGDVFGSYKRLGEMLKYDGIRIGISTTETGGGDPITYSWDGHKKVTISLRLVGSGDKSFNNTWFQYYTAEYCCASGEMFPNYEDGYLYFYFNDFKSGWSDKTILEANKSQDYGNMVLSYVAGGCNSEWKRLVVSDMQLFRSPIDDPTEGLWEANYTAESWKALTDAYESHNQDAIAAAKAALVPATVIATTDNMMAGWTTANVNEVVTANSNKLADYILNGNADFTNNTTFEADNNLSLTAGVDFATGGMGWKNMDRSGTLAAGGANYGYPTLTVAGLSKAEGIRFKLDVSEGGSYDHIVVGLSNCAGHAYEQYATLVPSNFADGYVNIPWSAFEKASWGKAFDLTTIEQAIVFLVEVHGASAGTKVTISDLKGYAVATEEKLLGDLWQYNYTAASWAPLAEAVAALDVDAVAAAKANLVPLKTARVTGNLMDGWTTADVNATVTANSDKLCDSIGEGLNINNAWNAGDFSNNTTFEADNNLSLTATADFTGKAMGWKNMDRSITLQATKNGAYPALNVAGLSAADGIRFKLEANKPIERILIGLSTCSEPSPFATGGNREMYAMKIKPEYVGADGYINIPFSYFEKAFWSNKFAQDELDQAIVFIVEAYGAENGTKLTISDLHGYIARDFDDSALPSWRYNYTPESFAAYSSAIRVAKTAADRDAAIALLVSANIKTVTENFFKGWTTDDVNAVVTANPGQVKDSIGDGLNANGVWNAGDFSANTTLTADNNISLTATADFAGKSMGWKNLDRSATLNPDKNPDNAGADYPFMAANVKGLSKAEGVRFKLEVTGGTAERILIGLSNCNTMVREQYAIGLKAEYVDAEGYINIPFSVFEKAWWCNAFTQEELENVIVFIIEAYGVTEGTTITVSDFRGYKTIVAPTQDDLDALDAVIAKLAAFDYENRYAELAAAAAAAKTAVDQDIVLDAIDSVKAVTDKLDGIDRSVLKANIDAVTAIDETLWATEIAAGVEAYYNLDADQAAVDAAAKVLKRIIDKPAAPVIEVTEKTDTSVTLTEVAGAKYKMNDGEWQDSNVFENLLPNKAYAFSAYIPENDDHIASDASVAIEVTTEKGSFGEAAVAIDGVERYAEVLTATVTDVPEYLGVYTIEWRNEAGETVGTGETYTVTADDIGSFVYAVLVSENALDTVASDATGTIGKGIIKNYVLPSASDIQYPQTLGDSVLSGADTGDVTGTWAWVHPELQPLSGQTGSAFDVTFTPDEEFIDLYEIIEARVVVTIIPAPYEPATFTNADPSSDLTVSGDFMLGTEMHVTNIGYNNPAYLALLRASGKDNSGLKKLVLFKSFSFTVNGEPISDVYDGELTVSSFVGYGRAGQTVSAWFFVDGKTVNYEGTVDSDGVLFVTGITL